MNNLLRLKVEESSKWEQSNTELAELNTQLNKDKYKLEMQLQEFRGKVTNFLSEMERLHVILETLRS